MKYSINETLDHMLFLTRHIRRRDNSAILLAILLELNFPVHKDGFGLLIEAILIKARSQEMRMSSVYEEIVEKSKESIGYFQIEQSIRATIRIAWERRNHEDWLYYFPERDICKKYPSNKVFISQICNLLMLLNACEEVSYETR